MRLRCRRRLIWHLGRQRAAEELRGRRNGQRGQQREREEMQRDEAWLRARHLPVGTCGHHRR